MTKVIKINTGKKTARFTYKGNKAFAATSRRTCKAQRNAGFFDYTRLAARSAQNDGRVTSGFRRSSKNAKSGKRSTNR